MAYARTIVYASSLFTWQEVQLEAAYPSWSDPYLVEGPRLLLPLTSCFECGIGRITFVCDPTTALWLSPGQPYRLRRPWSQQRSALLIVNGDLGPSWRASVSLSTHQLLHSWSRQLAARQAEPLEIDEGLAGLVQALQREEYDSALRPHRAVERAREYIAAQPERNDTLTEIANAAHCSAFHLARRFRHHTGQSLHAYRTRLRMTRALYRLHQGECNLSALAMDLGYSSHSHFTAVFRRTFGRVPNSLRAKPGSGKHAGTNAKMSTISTASGVA